MPVLRKARLSVQDKKNGLYSNPPKEINSTYIKLLLRNGDVNKLEQLVIDGSGKLLLGEHSNDFKTRIFLKSVPIFMSLISQVHDAVNSGRLEELQKILEDNVEKKKKLVLSKDEAGVGLLHKAVYYDLVSIYTWLIKEFPQIVLTRDAEGRTAYHYTPMCKDINAIQKLLINAGVDKSVLDSKQHSAKYYINHPQELELPTLYKSSVSSSKSIGSNDSEC